MLFCQLGQAKSLREIEDGLLAAEGRLRHLGMQEVPAHSTLAYANPHRPWQVYETLSCRCSVPASRRNSARPSALHAWRCRNGYSTVIDLCAKVFEWGKSRKVKGVGKLPLLLDHEGFLPHCAVVTEGHASDIGVARKLDLLAGRTLVFDCGYCD